MWCTCITATCVWFHGKSCKIVWYDTMSSGLIRYGIFCIWCGMVCGIRVTIQPSPLCVWHDMVMYWYASLPGSCLDVLRTCSEPWHPIRLSWRWRTWDKLCRRTHWSGLSTDDLHNRRSHFSSYNYVWYKLKMCVTSHMILASLLFTNSHYFFDPTLLWRVLYFMDGPLHVVKRFARRSSLESVSVEDELVSKETSMFLTAYGHIHVFQSTNVISVTHTWKQKTFHAILIYSYMHLQATIYLFY